MLLFSSILLKHGSHFDYWNQGSEHASHT
jgi:hypothetical protein